MIALGLANSGIPIAPSCELWLQCEWRRLARFRKSLVWLWKNWWHPSAPPSRLKILDMHHAIHAIEMFRAFVLSTTVTTCYNLLLNYTALGALELRNPRHPEGFQRDSNPNHTIGWWSAKVRGEVRGCPLARSTGWAEPLVDPRILGFTWPALTTW